MDRIPRALPVCFLSMTSQSLHHPVGALSSSISKSLKHPNNLSLRSITLVSYQSWMFIDVCQFCVFFICLHYLISFLKLLGLWAAVTVSFPHCEINKILSFLIFFFIRNLDSAHRDMSSDINTGIEMKWNLTIRQKQKKIARWFWQSISEMRNYSQ